MDDNAASHLDVRQPENFNTNLLQEKPAPPQHRLAPVLTPREDAANFQALCRGQQLLVGNWDTKHFWKINYW